MLVRICIISNGQWIASAGESNYRLCESGRVVHMHGAEFTEVHFTQREEVAARWQKCKYHTKSSSEQSSESIDLCTDAKQEVFSMHGEFAEFSNTSTFKISNWQLASVYQRSGFVVKPWDL